ADKSIGVGRSEEQVVKIKVEVDDESVRKAVEVIEKEEKKEEGVVTIMDKVEAPENKFAREDEIFAFAKRFNVADSVAQRFAVDESKTVDDLRKHVQENLRAVSEATEATPAQPAAGLDLSPKDVKRY